jgi:cytosine/uracil/thiamine/allantoin permease
MVQSQPAASLEGGDDDDKTKTKLRAHSPQVNFTDNADLAVKIKLEYTWSTYDRLLFWLTGSKSIWSYVGQYFLTFLIFLSSL